MQQKVDVPVASSLHFHRISLQVAAQLSVRQTELPSSVKHSLVASRTVTLLPTLLNPSLDIITYEERDKSEEYFSEL